MKNGRVREYCEIGMLTALISVAGAFKIPSIVPGLEFQLSAPIAVAICVVFGFKKYIISGILSSVLGLMLGTQTLISVAIAMQFRLIVGLLLYLAQNKLWAVILSGPIASIIARLTLSVFFGKAFTFGVLMAAAPGFVVTALLAPFLVTVLRKIQRVGVRYGV